ncbi:hypothetical protein B0H66DRAFT_39561 [Apodospora peruviana]|uniref:Uncharacterized protein n=1 Tax=Apodospora peruviana TaxID=516989 RepID=A0AAE0MG81_9PEZI|nr:hypothetical protein B0H66DRAFT_39561 [Apodospora peruviana]
MLTNYFPPSPDGEGGEASLPQTASDPQSLWENVEYTAWMSSNPHNSALSSSPNGHFNNTWQGDYPALSQGSSLSSSAPEPTWPNAHTLGYGPAPTNNMQSCSRNTSPTGDYFGTSDSSVIHLSASYPKAPWDTSDQPLYSPFSEVPPLIEQPRGLSVNNVGLNPSYFPGESTYFKAEPGSPVSPSPISSSSPSATTTTTTATSSSKGKGKSKSKASSDSSKSSAPARSRTSSTTSSKRKLPSQMNLPLPQEVHRIASEHISREAWRICKAEAVEMAQRRVKLLEHESGALERDTQQLQHNIELMRQVMARSQVGLEDAVRRAERLAASPTY